MIDSLKTFSQGTHSSLKSSTIAISFPDSINHFSASSLMLSFCQGLANLNMPNSDSTKKKKVVVFLSHLPGQEITCGAIIGLLRTAARELSSVVTFSVVVADLKNEEAAKMLSQFLMSNSFEQGEFLLSEGKWFERKIEKVSLPQQLLGSSQPITGVVRADGGYLITGGTGGFGMSLAKELVHRNAKRVVLASRGKPHQDTIKSIELLNLRAGRTCVTHVEMDVANLTSVSSVISSFGNGEMPSLCGIFHAAGALRDSLLKNSSQEDMGVVLSTKIDGAMNIRTALKQLDVKVDFLVLFSSIAGVFGSVAQGSYSAANNAIEEIAQVFVKEGIPAIAVAWGPLSGAGMFSRLGKYAEEVAEAQGIIPISIEAAASILINLIAVRSSLPSHMAVLRLDWKEIARSLPTPLASLILAETKQTSISHKQTSKTKEEIAHFLVHSISEHSGIDSSAVDIYRPFQEYSLDSMAAMSVSKQLGAFLGYPVNPIILYDFATIDRLSEHLGYEPSDDESSLLSQDSSSLVKSDDYPVQEPLAIVGIACRFPKSSNPNEFWQLLENGQCASAEIPKQFRFDMEKLYNPDPGVPGKIISKYACLVDSIDMFDHKFFRITQREATQMDPQQRMLLECTWEALEDACIIPTTLAGSKTCVYVGIGGSDYAFKVIDYTKVDGYGGPGNASSVASNRISYMFDLKGPSASVDTACSSSLVALDAACHAIYSGRATMGIVGGVNSIVNPGVSITFSKAGMLAVDGKCKSFDAAADGYVRGEGCGVIVIKPLSKALEDKNPIYSLIRGTAVNHVGRSNGLTAPSGPAQEACLREAYARAHIDPSSVLYVEAHGTGTGLGDPIEANALGAVFGGTQRPSYSPLLIGSVKTNIGHTECASGVAGVIKLVLSLQNGVIPPSLNFKKPNPNIDFEKWRMKVVTQLTPIPRNSSTGKISEETVVGVSSYGFGGANCHVCLSGFSQNQNSRSPPEAVLSMNDTIPMDGIFTYLVSARSKKSLHRNALAAADSLKCIKGTPLEVRQQLYNACWSSTNCRTLHPIRAVAVGQTLQEIINDLTTFGTQDSSLQGSIQNSGAMTQLRSFGGSAKVAFVYGGQGSQWAGMGRQLLSIPDFVAAISQVDSEILRRSGWSVLKALQGPDEDMVKLLADAGAAQPLLFAIQYALTAVIRSRGITPFAVCGHSTGEIAAACTAGAISLSDAITVVIERSKVMRKATGAGRMAHIQMPMSEAEAMISSLGLNSEISIAACNSPSSCVISGNTETILNLVKNLKSDKPELVVKVLEVDYAYHSHQMEPFKKELFAALEQSPLSPISPSSSEKIVIVSSVTGEITDPISYSNHTYWCEQMRKPVLFSRAASTLIDSLGVNIMLEISPRAVLGSYIKEISSVIDVAKPVHLPVHKKIESEVRFLYRAIGSVLCLGACEKPITQALFPQPGTPTRPPRYCFNRKSCWVDQPALIDVMSGNFSGSSSGGFSKTSEVEKPFLKARFSSGGITIWNGTLSVSSYPFLKDHCVGGQLILPGTAILEFIAEASEDLFGESLFSVNELELLKPIIIPSSGNILIQVSAKHGENAKNCLVEVYSRKEKEKTGEDSMSTGWDLHATGKVSKISQSSSPSQEIEATSSTSSASTSSITKQELYDSMKMAGLEYGPAFQGVSEINILGNGNVISAIVTAPESIVTQGNDKQKGEYVVHPAILDSCCQVMAAGLVANVASASAGSAYLPFCYRDVSFGKSNLKLGSQFRVTVSNMRVSESSLIGTIRVDDLNGLFVIQIGEFENKRAPLLQRAPHQYHKLSWEEVDVKQPSQTVDETSKKAFLLLSTDGPIKSSFASSLFSKIKKSCPFIPVEHVNLPQESVLNDEECVNAFSALISKACKQFIDVQNIFVIDLTPLECCDISSDEFSKNPGLLTSHSVKLLKALRNQIGIKLRSIFLSKGASRIMQSDVVSPSQFALIGINAVVHHEMPELCSTVIDIGNDVSEDDLVSSLVMLPKSPSELALRKDGQILKKFVRHIVPSTPFEGENPSSDESEKLVAQSVLPFCVNLKTPGNLDSISLKRVVKSTAISHGYVEIKTQYAALNFRDVMIALGMYPVSDATAVIGGECSGIISRIGEGVSNLQVGDRVLTMWTGCFSSSVVVPQELVICVPSCLEMSDAAGILGVFATAHYALKTIGRMRKGETILIHAAAGGVGLAAIQVAKSLQLEIIATAGSDEKRDLLKKQFGVQHVFDSRSSQFVSGVKSVTKGRGVDAVLNSLAGDLLSQSITLLASGGRFLEIGKRDVYENAKFGMRALAKNASFNVIAIDSLLENNPAEGISLLKEVVECFSQKEYLPSLKTIFRADKASEAFQMMSRAKHVGKILLDFTPSDLVINGPYHGKSLPVSKNGTYLVTGGLGGLGLLVSDWLARSGAGCVLAVSRSSPSKEQSLAIEAISASSPWCKAVACSADVSDFEAVRQLISRCGTEFPPLKGVVHAAGVLSDALISHQTSDTIKKVMQPKISGAFNIDAATTKEGISLDFFVLFGSVSSILGTPGQINYSAANSVLDGFVQQMCSAGKHAICIHWSPLDLGGSGMFGKLGEKAGSEAIKQGLTPLKASSVLSALGEAITAQPLLQSSSVVVAPIDWARYIPLVPSSPVGNCKPARFDIVGKIEKSSSNSSSPFVLSLMKLPGAPQREEAVKDVVVEVLSKVLGVSKRQFDPNSSLSSLGVDSLIAAELKGRFEAQFGSTLPISVFLQGGTIIEFSKSILNYLLPGESEEKASSEKDINGKSHDSVTLKTTKKKSCLSVLSKPKNVSSSLHPVFLLCPFGGTAAGLSQLSDALGEDRPVYALEDPLISNALSGIAYGLPQPITTMHEWACAYADEMLELQPVSSKIPFHLVGVSIGGAVAVELAEVLRSRGASVSSVCLIDSPPRSVLTSTTPAVDAVSVVLGIVAANFLHARAQSQGTASHQVDVDLHEITVRFKEVAENSLGTTTSSSQQPIIYAPEVFLRSELASFEVAVLKEFERSVGIPSSIAEVYYSAVRQQASRLLGWVPTVSSASSSATSSSSSSVVPVYRLVRASGNSAGVEHVLRLAHSAHEWAVDIEPASLAVSESLGSHFTTITDFAKQTALIIFQDIEVGPKLQIE
eukprot:TRINITY_DN5102_c0_g1_i1.p1 TRINITY_DN5102_c0_g1~~TRINITY_DN5102_c0_g1_i1.p1  ORF type:complete len:3157 (-),score=925.73 TRINITY_DN5102_c0_g1_i1:47-9412(-)